jgi:hypothetical protein
MSLTGKPSLTTPSPFVNDGFWFDLDLGELMSRYRIPAEYDNEAIKWGLTLGVVNVNMDLEPVKLAIIDLGHVTADAYVTANPADLSDSDSFVILYSQAVYSYAKALLLKQFNSMNQRLVAENDVKDLPETEQYWLDQSAQAVAKLFKKILPDTDKSGNKNLYAVLI